MSATGVAMPDALDQTQEILAAASKQGSQDALMRSSKNKAPGSKVAFESASPKLSKTSTRWKPSPPPCRFSVPPSCCEGMAELLRAQVDSRTRILRQEVRYRRALK